MQAGQVEPAEPIEPAFVPGLELARRFHADVVGPIVTKTLPAGAEYAAALIGPGSEVLGYDTPRSRDHDWGPRCQVFLDPHTFAGHGADLVTALTAELPERYLGYPTRFELSHTPGLPTHHVQVHDVEAWWRAWSGVSGLTDPAEADGRGCRAEDGPSLREWLRLPTQRLAELTGGQVFRDDAGWLRAARMRLRFYPDDLWRYMLACTWARIGEEHAFVGRCAEVGDELGSALVAARIARDVMRLWVLMDRRYPPYSKWLGSAFAATPGAEPVRACLQAAVRAESLPAREDALVQALSATVVRHDELASQLGHDVVDPRPRRYFDRPFRIVDVESVVAGLRAGISDLTLAAARPVAAVDAVVDNVGVSGDLDVTGAIVAAVLPTDCAPTG